MACTSPNLIEHDARYKGITFLGKAPGFIELYDLARQRYIDSYVTQICQVPCGKCLDCRIARRYERACRIMLESKMYSSSVFITLTIAPENIGFNDLAEDNFTQFQKDFRAKYGQAKYCNIRDRGTKREGKTYSKTFKKFKFVKTGEYGGEFGRKHYHAIIFNHSFRDAYDTGFFSKKGNPIYSSHELEKLWGLGTVQVENLTFDLALYVGQYITNGWDDDQSTDLETGLIRKKEFSTMSHGIGLAWLKKYYKSVLSIGKISLDDRDVPIPRYYHKKMAVLWPIAYAQYRRKKLLKLKRKNAFIKQNKGDGPLARQIRKGQITKIVHQRRTYA